MFGYDFETVQGRWLDDFLTDESAKHFEHRFPLFIANGEIREFEFTVVRSNGSHVQVSVEGKLEFDESGNFIQAHCILHNVAKKVEAEEILKASEKRFRGLFESTLDGLVYYDRNGSLLSVNPAFCTMLGSTPEDLLGKNVLDITPKKWHSQNHLSFIGSDWNEKDSDEFEKEYFHKQGHPVPVSVRVWTSRDEVGTLLGIWGVVRDLTEQKAAEQNITLSEERYRLLAQNAEDVIWTVDNDLNYTYISPSVKRLLGNTAEDLMGNNITDAMPESSLKIVTDTYQRTLEAEAKGEADIVIRAVVELQNNSGSTVWAEIIVKPMRDDSGTRIGFVGVTRNITERKKAKLKIEGQRNTLDALLNATMDSVGMLALDGTIETINQNMADTLGGRAKDLIGKNILDYLPREVRLGRVRKFNEVIKSKKEGQLQDIWSGRILKSRFYPVLNDADDVVSVAIYSRDVTESVLNEEARKQSEKQYRRIVETANEGIIGLDGQGRITYANQNTAEFFGYKITELIDRPMEELIRPEDRQEQRDYMKQRAKGIRDRYTRCFVRKDGKNIWGLVSVTPLLAEDGALLGVFAMISDITEVKEAENRLRESENRYRQIVETASEGILVTNSDTQIDFVNKLLCDTLGYTADELLGQRIPMLVFPEDHEDFTTKMHQLRQEGVRKFDHRLRHKKGHAIWVHSSISLILDDDGNNLGSLDMITDISERKKTEERLKLTQYSVDNAPLNIYWLNAQGQFVYVNDRSCDNLGYTREELLQLTVSDIEFEFEFERWSDYWQKRRTHVVKNFETNLQRKNGTTFPISTTSHYKKSGGQELLFCFSYDLTKQHAKDEMLRRSQELLNEVQRISLTGGWEVDLATGETHWTDGQFRLHGLDPSQSPSNISRFFEQHIHPEDRDMILKGWDTVLRKKTPVKMEYRAIKGDGSEAVFIGMAVPEVGENGEVKRVYGSTRDMTMEHQAAEELELAHERILNILEGIDADVYVSDIETHEVLFMNAHMQKYFGTPAKDAPCYKSFRNEMQPCAHCAKPIIIDDNGKPTETIIHERYNPLTKRWYLNHDRAIPWLKGKVVHMHMAADITNLKTLEKELKFAMTEAEAANLAKNEFLANMSHEIRTPLNGLLGMLQILQLTSLEEEQQEYLVTALDSGRSLLRILNDILDLSKIESGKLELDECTFELGEVLDSVVSMFRLPAKSRGVEVIWAIDANLHRHFLGDKGRLRQILFNLVGNATKFTNSGSVTVEAYPMPHQLADGRTLIYFSITDTGIGVPKDKVGSIFDPFIQADGSFSRKYQGTGLGLSIVNRLISLMSGSIAISAQEGVGTTITFTVAARPEAAPSPPLKINLSTDKKTHLSMLVAEDERVNRTVVHRLLGKIGHKATCVESGEAALKELKARSFDCILMDIQMPGLNGMETTRAIRETMKIDTPIIALTAHAMKGDREAFMEAGMNGYVAKPFELANLEKEIRRVMTKAKTASD